MKKLVYQPPVPTREFLDEIVSRWYLFKMNYAAIITGLVEIPLFMLPGWLLRMRVLEPQARASRGSVDAATMAK